MKKTSISPKVYAFTPYMEDAAYFNTAKLDPGLTIRGIINNGIHVFKGKAKKYQVIQKASLPLGDSVSAKLFQVDSRYIENLVRPDLKLSDILREMFSLGIESQRSSQSGAMARLERQVSALQASVEGLTELTLILGSRSVYNVEFSSAILKSMIEPENLAQVKAGIVREGQTALRKLLTQLIEGEMPDWMALSLTQKVQRLEQK